MKCEMRLACRQHTAERTHPILADSARFFVFVLPALYIVLCSRTESVDIGHYRQQVLMIGKIARLELFQRRFSHLSGANIRASALAMIQIKKVWI